MTRGLHWFRNDLRLHDNSALIALQARTDQWLPVFVRDPRITERGTSSARRDRFMLACLERLASDLAERGVPLVVREGRPEQVLPELMQQVGATLLTYNQDVTPFARERDAAVSRAVAAHGGEVESKLDHVLFASHEVRTQAGGPYAVYTPYKRAWWKRWEDDPRLPNRVGRWKPPIPGFAADPIPSAKQDGNEIAESYLPTPGEAAAKRRLERFLTSKIGRYPVDRDYPAVDGTSRLSPYLRFGVISVRECVLRAMQASAADARLRDGVSKWLDELIWRDFYSAILEEHPRVMRENYRREYDAVRWDDDPSQFAAWCEGRTGFPIVDAGMRQLSATGWMHNRVRMIVASFLTKDLLIDWRRGERFFFEQLIDGDPASNNGGWQWAASTGTDAQPYFRIFNPAAQGKRWDSKGDYVRTWIPELRDVPAERIHAPSPSDRSAGYPDPIVNHAARRLIALDRFKQAKTSGRPQ